MNILFNLLIVAVALVWLALVVWTFLDSRRRVADRFAVGCATLGALIFPFLGALIYLIVRPPELLEDIRERELGIAAAEARLASERIHSCPHCDAPTEREFLRCPSCLRKLRDPCGACSKPLDSEWRICPYCEHDRRTAPAEPAPATRRRRAAGSDQTGEIDAAPARKAPSRATTKAAAKRQTRRRVPADDGAAIDASPSGDGISADARSSRDADGSPEPEPTV